MTQTEPYYIKRKGKFLENMYGAISILLRNTSQKLLRNDIHQTADRSHCWAELEKTGIHTLYSSIVFECVKVCIT